MGPDTIRKRWRLAACGGAILSCLPILPGPFSASAAFAQEAVTQSTSLATVMPASAPLAIAFGAGAFGLIALFMMRGLVADGRARQRRARDQIAGLRAELDSYESLLAGAREITIFWGEARDKPALFGQAAGLLPPGRPIEAALKFSAWLQPDDAERLGRLVVRLKAEGQAFETHLTTLADLPVRLMGWTLAGGAALRIAAVSGGADTGRNPSEGADARAIIDLLRKPAFLRDTEQRLVFANAAYQRLLESAGRTPGYGELLDPVALRGHLSLLASSEAPVSARIALGQAGTFELVERPIAGGSVGMLRALSEPGEERGPGISHIAGIIETLASPIAIFDAAQRLVQFNTAYQELWTFPAGFLVPGLNERVILDRLRTQSQLPATADYRLWRAEHLSAYDLTVPREEDPWHLPDGRSIKVIAAPAGPDGGVIYVFEDITERLKLESANKAFSNVQRESLNALKEAVAVFGTNGRLTLHNPKLEEFWGIDIERLGQNPHIDQIAEACAEANPEDGRSIWRDLKAGIVDLSPRRTDRTGRLARADGQLYDYSITRLPDGQTMMSFLDVTESARYSEVLKERNEALMAADAMKDAFVHNVSYELRSPLTNIIGFADLLAADGQGLSERQRSYTDYIRASSTTLGVLIDNILDLASVDAGVAELQLEPQDVPALVEKARAGLWATHAAVPGENPVDIRIDIAPDLPAFVADGTRIVQILYNLLSNAQRFSPPGGTVRLSVSGRGERMLFVVEDDGPGLVDAMREAIHARLDAPTTASRLRGAGLGLAIVKTYVNLHGGTVRAERREPTGSRITVNLPCDRPGQAELTG